MNTKLEKWLIAFIYECTEKMINVLVTCYPFNLFFANFGSGIIGTKQQRIEVIKDLQTDSEAPLQIDRFIFALNFTAFQTRFLQNSFQQSKLWQYLKIAHFYCYIQRKIPFKLGFLYFLYDFFVVWKNQRKVEENLFICFCKFSWKWKFKRILKFCVLFPYLNLIIEMTHKNYCFVVLWVVFGGQFLSQSSHPVYFLFLIKM